MTTSVPTFNFLALLIYISEIKRVSQNLMWGLLAPCRTSYTLKLLCLLKVLGKVKQRAKFQHRIFMHHAVMGIYGLTQLLHAELHWLDVADRVTYKLGWMAYKCLHGQAPDYLSELCMPVAQVAERQHLHSASRNLLVAPRFQLNTYGRRAFAVAAPGTWNTLSDELRNPDLHSATFRRNLKTFLFRQYLTH